MCPTLLWPQAGRCVVYTMRHATAKRKLVSVHTQSHHSFVKCPPLSDTISSGPSSLSHTVRDSAHPPLPALCCHEDSRPHGSWLTHAAATQHYTHTHTHTHNLLTPQRVSAAPQGCAQPLLPPAALCLLCLLGRWARCVVTCPCSMC